MKDSVLSTPKSQLIIIILTYLVLSSLLGFAYRYEITPDTIVFIRLAQNITQGQFAQSVTRAWPPLITWLMSPFLFFGFSGLTSYRILSVLSGLTIILASWLLTLRFGLSKNVRFIAGMTSAVLIAQWTGQKTGPHLLFTAFVICYLYIATNPQIMNDRKLSFYCGIVGGFAYLTKHYAFPFFLMHYPLLLIIRGYIDREKKSMSFKKVFISLMVGAAGLLTISSIWIAIMSVKYEKLTISSAGYIVHSIVGPKDIDRRSPLFYGGLHKPKDTSSLHVHEDPSEVKYKTWSPFENKQYFMHQLQLIRENLIHIFNHFVRQSPYFTYPLVIGIIVLIPIAFSLTPLNKEKKFLYLWVIVTFGVYCSGLIFTFARSTKYFYPLMVAYLCISFHFLEELRNLMRDINGKITTGWTGKLLSYYLLLIFVLAFTLKPGLHFLKSAGNILKLEQVNAYKEIAEQVNTTEFPWPYAFIRSSQKSHTDLYIAYYLEKQFLGRPLSTDVEGITEELRAVDAKSLLVFDNPTIVEKLKHDNRYDHIASKQFKDDKRYLNTVNIKLDGITGWDKEVNIFLLKRK